MTTPQVRAHVFFCARCHQPFSAVHIYTECGSCVRAQDDAGMRPMPDGEVSGT